MTLTTTVENDKILLDQSKVDHGKVAHMTLPPAVRSYVEYPAAGDGAGRLIVGPASYGVAGRGASIKYVVTESCCGPILLAATNNGLCWLGIHESAAYLEQELRADFHAAEFINDAAALIGQSRHVNDYVAGHGGLRLSLDLRATAFQAAVWAELCAIARGGTRSYGEIAARLGRTRASRAVGHANGANPLAVIIPCHRAIGANGSLTGYRWGLEYKRRLLEHERALAQAALGLR